MKQKLTLYLLIFSLGFSFLLADGTHININKSDIIFGDGDTFTANGIILRFAGVDTPEEKNPEHNLLENQYLGEEAAEFTKRQVEKAKSVYYLPCGTDRYGRILAYIFVDNKLLPLKIVEAGLGYETITKYGDNGYPEFAKKILDASQKIGRPNFENPLYFRAKQRRKAGVKDAKK